MLELPLVQAVEFRRDFPSGATCPCVFLCESQEGDFKEYVTKMRHSVRGSGLAFEHIAHHLALYFNVDCPPAAIVSLDFELAMAQKRNEALRERIIRNIGLNFGTMFLEGSVSWLPSLQVPLGLQECAAEIIAFDALIDNADRRRDKSNLLFVLARLFVIDHELSFAFIREIGISGKPWFQRLNFLKDHPLYSSLQGKQVSLEKFHERLTSLDDSQIDQICASVPDEFAFEHGEAVANHLRKVRDDRDAFVRGIKEVLR